MHFSGEDVRRFADWSGDRNPLHVDEAHARETFFGQTVVHGVLTVLRTLASGELPADRRPATSVDVEFRGAVTVGPDYAAGCARSGDDLLATLRSSEGVVLNVRLGSAPALPPADPEPSWAASPMTQPVVREHPADRHGDELRRGVDVTGTYPLAGGDEFARGTGLTPVQARVLALCSYVTGMEAPGLRSLFTRLNVQFHTDTADAAPVHYRARTVRFDSQFRLLDTQLEVVDAAGRPIASASLRSYVPFSPAATDAAELRARLGGATKTLAGKVALVLGGTRGLGAEIAAALAVAGSHVYVAARSDDRARRRLEAALADHGRRVEFLQGDAGDATWCERALHAIQARHGGLDVLVLNACAPPAGLGTGPGAVSRHAAYVRANLQLVETPLAAFLGPLSDRAGAVVCISSWFVTNAPAGLGHYVAVKQAAEAMVRTAARESGAFSLIARPPVLQTRWNDTPAAIAGAIPANWAASHIVNALAEKWLPEQVEVLDQFPPFETAARREESAPIKADFTIRLAASFTTDALLPSLEFWVRELELDASIDVAPYGQVLQSLLDPSGVLNDRGRGIGLVLLRVGDWLRELPDDQARDVEFVRRYLDDTARDFVRAMQAHRAQASSETLLVLCPSHGASSSAESILVRRTEEDLASDLSAMPGLQVIRAGDFHARYGVDEDAIADPLRDEIAHIPYRDEYLHTLGTIAVRHIYRRMAPIRKVVAVDCDNTLWRGVVGEVGAEGVEIDAGHRALHEALTRLAQSGVLVCLCSKNEEADVWSVFDTRADLLLPRAQVVAAMIDWQPKSQNLRTLASRLNLGLDSFVFVDDNPVECAEVRANCPEVLTIQWPTDSDRALRLLDHLWEFDPSQTTKEDARRTQLYREEFKRQALRADALTFEDFIDNLQLVVDMTPLAPEDLRRAAQLTLRTNQFNFTTVRREESDVQALVAGGRHDVRTVRVRDRFGDYGLVGLTILERGDHVWTLDTFLLSCRVLGRGVEHRIVSELARIAAHGGARAITLRFAPTRRNTPARTFLESFAPPELRRQAGEVVEYELPVDQLAAVRFEPQSASETGVAEEADAASAPAAGTLHVERLRRRERQIGRTAFDLSTIDRLRAAVEGRPAEAAQPAAESTDVATVVYQAFADALRMPVAAIRETDRLEALGCDSLRIVEITVALAERFPGLPPTLLFEHRAVSQIVREIAALTSRDVPEPQSLAVAPAASPARPRGGDVAVVGMHVRCAGAQSPAELWDLLSSGRSAVRPVPPARTHFLQPLDDSRPHWAGLLDDAGRFDAEFFGISPREAEFMDPQVRLFLEVAWGALEDGGCAGDGHDPDTGVFVGVMYADYGFRANLVSRASGNPYRCWEGFSLANRLSQLLAFRGPSIAVDTACSSSGTALHLACAALTAGDCRVALVGGVNLILDPDRFASLGRLGILSASGKCEPFGADADGTVLGEGAGVVVLRPLEDAIRRGDRVYGIIKGTGVSTGNGTVGFTAPNPQAQAEAIRRSLQAANVDPRTVSYVEAHGTGTALGDPIEVRGLTLGYGTAELRRSDLTLSHRCTIGSIKPNIGHLEAGAGVVGLIKVLLQLQHGMLVPSRTSATPNPQIAFTDGPFDVQRQLTEWTRPSASIDGRTTTVPRRAGLSSFGVGGANAHVIVEEPPVGAAESPRGPERPLHLLALSGRDDAALGRQATQLSTFLETHADLGVADVCFSVNTGRKALDERATFAAATRDELLAGLRACAAGTLPRNAVRGTAAAAAPRIAFLYTGQGSQYPGMGRALHDTQPVFRTALERCANVLDRVLERPLLDVMFAAEGTADAALLHQTGYTQPALFALEYALSELWQSWGIRPDVVMGHSVGEIAAMCVAGGISLDDGLRLIAARGRLMQALPSGGTMTSVMADEARVLEAIAGAEDLVAIAAINAPDQVVISGAGAAVAEIAARLTAGGVKTKPLTVSHAFHSPLMRPMLAEYERVVRGIRFQRPTVPVVSCVDGVISGDTLAQPEYWLRQVMDPVRFAAGVRVLEQQRVGTYIEIGPHPVLLGMGRQSVVDDSAADWLPSIRKEGDAWQTLLGSLGKVYTKGGRVDWRAFDAAYARRRVSVPAYAFKPTQYWLRDTPAVPRLSSGGSGGATLQSATPAEAAVYRMIWQRQECAPARAATGQHWVVFADRSELGAELAQALASRGAVVTTVVRGETFRTVADGRFELNPSVPDHFEQLWATLTARGPEGPPLRGGAAPRVAYLWMLDAPANAELEQSLLRDETSEDLVGLSHLVQLFDRHGVSERAVWAVTRNAVQVASAETSVAVAQAMAWGFGRTAALEHPELWGGLVDLEDARPAIAAVTLCHELTTAGREDQVALRGADRYVARLEHAPVALAQPAFAADGTFLVTGGTGALGLHVARWLVAHGARHLVLASRRGAVDAAREAELRSLLQSGASVSIVAADLSRSADVDALLARIAAGPAPLRGIVHAAGVDSTIPIRSMRGADLAFSLAGKTTGAWLLHERTRRQRLDLFVVFSSVASTLGAQGRAHYAAANAFLDALAAERSYQGLPALAVSWGPWKNGGMATAAHLEAFERIGNRGLAPEGALRALGALVVSGAASASVADLDWPVFRRVYESRRERPLLDGIDGATPRSPAASSPAGSSAPWVAHLGTVQPSERMQTLSTLLRAQVAKTLGFEDAASVPMDRSFSDLGADSLLMADLAAQLKRQTALPCGTLVFDYPTVRLLAEQLDQRLPRAAAAGDERPSTEPPVTSVADAIREEVARTLGVAGPEAVAVDRAFSDMGLDSLLATELGSRLEKRLGVRATRLVFAHPTVSALAAQLAASGPPAAECTAPAQMAAAAADASGDVRCGTVGYTAAAEPEIFAFQRTAWPHRNSELIPARWRWMFVESAKRLAQPPRVWLHRDDGNVVAHMGSIPVRLKLNSTLRDTGWLVDTMVLPSHRNRALGARLMMDAHEEQPFSLSLGQTAEMRAIQLRLGWTQVAPLQIAQALVRPGNVLRGKLPAPAAWVAGAGLRASTAVRDLLRDRPRLEAHVIERFDHRHDRLWNAVAPQFKCAVVRDASYLNWKYVDQPGQRFLRLELRDGDELKGIAVWLIREADDVYRYRRAFLADLVAPIGDATQLADVVRTACAAAADTGVDALVCMHISAALTAALQTCGFRLRTPERFLLVNTGALAEPDRNIVMSEHEWFVTHGDSDIDRPW